MSLLWHMERVCFAVLLHVEIAEPSNGLDTFGEAVQGVEQGDYLGTLKQVGVIDRTKIKECGRHVNTQTLKTRKKKNKAKREKGEECLLEMFIVVREQDLECSAKTGCLDFPPKPAFLTSNTVHDRCDVPEMISELELQCLCLGSNKHGLLIKDRGRLDRCLNQLVHHGLS